MKEKALFTMMFPDYEPPEALKSALSQAVIVAADLDVTQRVIEVELALQEYLNIHKIQQLQEYIENLYELRRFTVTCTYPREILTEVDAEDLLSLFVSQNSMTMGSLAGAKWNWDGECLTISLQGNGAEAVKECIPQVKACLDRQFSANVDIQVLSGEVLEGNELFQAMDKLRKTEMEKIPTPQFNSASKKTDSSSGAFFGKAFKGAPISMKELNLDMGNVVVEGRVFAVDHRELKKRNAWVISFDMTDDEGSVRVKRFMEAGEAQPILENIAIDKVVRVHGKLTVDKFDNETVLSPYSMMKSEMKIRTDDHEGEKRVELHLHTVMSNMDALTNVGKAIRQAAAWGHKAIAITDHGCVQSFTDAFHVMQDKKPPVVAGTDTPIKVLYGCEGYYINDVDDRLCVQGNKSLSTDGEFVAFDFETTGLHAATDTIIEIGAVRIRNGEEIDRFQTFVNPGVKLNPRVVSLTGITDEMVADAPVISEVLPRFLKFIQDSVLVAHNADFDMGFLRAACKKCGANCDFTSLDTLTLAQNLMPQLGRHKLDIVAKELGLDDFNHHRAGDDALVCGNIAAILLGKLRGMGVENIQDINAMMLPLRQTYRREAPHVQCQHIVMFAKNQTGLRNLYRLISEANLEHFKKFPRIFKSELMKHREGLIIGSACENNELFQAVVAGKPQQELERIASFYDYLEVQPISNNSFMLYPAKEGETPVAESVEQLQDFNRKIVALGNAMGKLVVATGDVHFLNPQDEIFRHILLATKGFKDCDRDNPLYFRTTDEMLKEFSYLGEETAQRIVITNPNLIADMCDTIRPVPRNLFAPKIENSVEDLKRLVYDKFHRLYGENPPEIMKNRVEVELNDIISCHYDVIYMSAQKLVQNSLEHGYLVGSRGSVGSSIVAFLSGITEVNSFPPHYRCPNPKCKHTVLDVPKDINCGADLPDAVCPKCGAQLEKDGFNIPFETFLGFGGDKVPDIDLNFSGEYQAKAHQYCTEMFGKSHVFRAGTIGTVAEKTAFGYAKKYAEERNLFLPTAEINRLSAGCVGVRRTTGQHPGGLVVIPQENEIWDFCPVQRPADDLTSDQITTHFDYHAMEENLLKLDMLGHDDPTMIRMLEDMTGVDAKTIPLDEKNVMSLFTSSKVLGYEDDKILGPTGIVAVPEFNTHFTREVLLDTKPTQFDTLVRISGYTHGTDVWLGNAKDLIMSGTAKPNETVGCRDDIMNYLIAMGLPDKRAFKIMESVRKGRGLPPGAEEEMVAAGVPDWYIESCKKIKYLFPKAHAVAYVLMAFRIAWFKVYHPLAFYAAYFYRRSQKGAFDAVMMTKGMDTALQHLKAIQSNENRTDKEEELLTTLEVVYEYYLRGFDFLPIDIYKSDALKFLLEDGKLLPPFVATPGLGENAAKDLVKGREGKQFLSIEEVAAACPKVSKTHMQMLKDAGAFGSLPETSQVSLFEM